jgi:hypothetical protein
MLSSCILTHPGTEQGGNVTPGGGDQPGGGGQVITDQTVYPTEITITGESSIAIGEATILKATYTPSNVTNKTVTWSSSDTTVASVSASGRVKGLKAGNTTITASMKGKDNVPVTTTFAMSVVVPSATSITLDKTSVNLGFGKTTHLSASVNSKYANQKVTWSSNNPSLISFSKTTTTNTLDSNNQLILDPVTITAGSSTGIAVITATSVDGGFTANCQVKVQEIVGATVMIYMCGADLESEYGLATSDLNEILSVSGQPDEVNIIVETGGANSWSKSQIPSDKLARWEISNRQFIKKQELTYASMGLTDTLQKFMEWGFENYSSEKYGLILWNHGGAMDGVCFDEIKNDSLTADEVYDAVSNAKSKKGITDKLEWVAYDACLMAVQDVAEYNSYNFNYMLASQESEAGDGYAYDKWVPTLYSNPGISGADLLPVIGKTFLQSFGNTYHDQTQAVYDLSKMSAYKSAFESIATDLNSIIGTNTTKIKSLANLIASAREYGLDENGDSSGFEVFDMKEALNKVKANSTFSSISSKVTTFFDKLDDLVIYEEHGKKTTGCGICIYSPWSKGNPYVYDSTEYTKSNFTEWKKVSNKIFDACYDPYDY